MLFPGAFVRLEGGVSSSLLFEIGVRNEASGDFLLGDVDHANATTGGGVSKGSISDGLGDEVLGFLKSEISSVVGVNEALHKSATGATHSDVFFLSKANHVHVEDLISFVGVPSRADHVGLETRVAVNNVL